ncbi:MAG TPA: type II toxin-antitoxin system RelE/ParE family toxin [Rhizomicrobium sp.]|jgi:phage-related protein
MVTAARDFRPVEWVGSSYKDFISFPDAVQDEMGYALYLAQTGRMHASAKPLKGFGGAGVVELVEDDRHGTYRAVYTVQFESAVYVLHAFQKKSRKGLKTPREEIELVRRRLKIAAADEQSRKEGTHE